MACCCLPAARRPFATLAAVMFTTISATPVLFRAHTTFIWVSHIIYLLLLAVLLQSCVQSRQVCGRDVGARRSLALAASHTPPSFILCICADLPCMGYCWTHITPICECSSLSYACISRYRLQTRFCDVVMSLCGLYPKRLGADQIRVVLRCSNVFESGRLRCPGTSSVSRFRCLQQLVPSRALGAGYGFCQMQCNTVVRCCLVWFVACVA